MNCSKGILFFALVSILTPQVVIAQSSSTGAQIAEVLFSEVEKQILERYFGIGTTEVWENTEQSSSTKDKGKGKKAKKGKKGGKKALPPGLAKRKELPPGLARRKSLPPGLAKRELPEDLQSQLPEPAPGTERIIVEGSVILIEKATSKVLDILENIVLGGQ